MNAFRITGPHKRYPSAGRCIYCGSVEGLSDEHIIPFALGGNVILPNASCEDCRKITGSIEGECAGGMMLPLRARMNIQTRRPKSRPKEFRVPIYSPDGEQHSLTFPSTHVPTTCIGIRLDPPTIVQGLPATGRVRGELYARHSQDAMNVKLAPGHAALIGKFRMEPFCRMIAKIGHAHVMAALVAEGAHPSIDDMFLPSVILGDSNEFQHYVGGDEDDLDESPAMHELRFNRYILGDRKILVSTVRLFAMFGMPRYHVVACYEP